MVTLGCARNEVDSEELAGRLKAAGWQVTEDPAGADAVLVNTCGFIDAAKQESIDTVLSLSDGDAGPAVLAVGCMAERYGRDLAAELPEADAVLGFDDYPRIAERLRQVMSGETVTAHAPRDRRTLLPVSPVQRPHSGVVVPGHFTGASSPAPSQTKDGRDAAIPQRYRLQSGPVAPVKIASGCDRRCAFCAIPRFRGAFLSRHPDDVIAEVRHLVESGVREVHLVSENSTSYGKDVSEPRLLEHLLRRLDDVDGLMRVRIAYLQPAEVRPYLLDTMADLGVVAAQYDLPFQHASGALLRRMRRFGDGDSFLHLIEQVRRRQPEAGIRSNVIVGFPGETDHDVQELLDFLDAADMDAVGVFAYSDEEGTEGESMQPKVDPDVIAARVDDVASTADQVAEARAARRTGETTQVLVETVTHGQDPHVTGRSTFQGPEDATTTIPGGEIPVGRLVSVEITGCEGVDLMAVPIGAPTPSARDIPHR